MSKIVVVIETDEQVKTIQDLANLLNGMKYGSVELNIEFITDRIAKLAKHKIYDGECIYDMCGGNVDDAYQRGLDDGEAMLAQEIIE